MKNTPELEDLLPAWIRRAGEIDHDMRNLAVDGHCDAFALALIAQLALSFPHTPTSVVVIRRQRVSLDDPGEIVDENPFSHVLVDINGALADVEGVGADERWEDGWIQPDEDDEIVACEDIFEYHAMGQTELIALRQARDGRDPDKDMIERFFDALSQSLIELRAQPGTGRRAKMG